MKRPVGVRVLATLSILSALFGVVQLCLSALGVEWLGMSHEQVGEPAWFGVVPAVARLALSGLYIALGVGLWRLRRWAPRVLVIGCLTGVAVSFGLPFVVGLLFERWEASFFAFVLFSAAACFLCLWYLGTPKVKRAFGV